MESAFSKPLNRFVLLEFYLFLFVLWQSNHFLVVVLFVWLPFGDGLVLYDFVSEVIDETADFGIFYMVGVETAETGRGVVDYLGGRAVNDLLFENVDSLRN